MEIINETAVQAHRFAESFENRKKVVQNVLMENQGLMFTYEYVEILVLVHGNLVYLVNSVV